MSYGDFAEFWTLTWLFFGYDKNNSGNVNDLEIMEGTQKQVTVVPLDKE